MQAARSYFGNTFGRLKVADKGMQRKTRAITLNYLSSESNLMEWEQGYGVALCLPNLPHEKHRLFLMENVHCQQITEETGRISLKGNWKYQGQFHVKQKGKEQSVPRKPGKKANRPVAHLEVAQTNDTRTLLIANFNSNHILPSNQL